MSDPFSAGGFDPRMFEQVPLFRELAKVMSWTGGPVNWDLARQTAEALASDAAPATGSGEALTDAVHVTELWLDEVTSLPAVAGPVRALSASEWVARATTSQGLGTLVEPLARGMSEALGKSLPEELQQMMGGAQAGQAMEQALGAMGAMMYGVQVGTIAGRLADQVLGCYDLGVPVLDPATVGTVGRTLERLAEDYEFDLTELRYWLAARESVHRRMYAGLPWLPARFAELVGRFASEADLDPGGMMEALGGMGFDPNDPAALERALEGPDAFRIEPTAGQQRVLSELQGLVAFTEGYAETAVAQATAQRLSSLEGIEETMRRRRAERGPGEQALAQLIGLDLTPADLHEGRAFCNAIIEARGLEGLDRAWQRVEHLPSPEELAEPSRWLVRMAAVELGVGEDPTEG